MTVLSFAFTMVVVQIRVERFIYNRIKKIYNDVSLLDVDDLKKTALTTNMETLSEEVKKICGKKTSRNCKFIRTGILQTRVFRKCFS